MTYTPELAYICMEFGINAHLKTYSGGLGILAGDTIKGYADMSIPAIGVGILYKEGYLDQEISLTEGQLDHAQEWNFETYMTKVGATEIPLHDQTVKLDIWEYIYTSPLSGSDVSIFFLDADIEGNSEEFRRASQRLYSDDKDTFYRQLIVLGLGSWYALQSMDIDIPTFHLNESHSALLALVLNPKDTRVTFTTHTPLAGGHTRMPLEVIQNLCTHNQCLQIPEAAIEGDVVNLTTLALEFADYCNAVSKKHQEVSSHMFPDHNIDYITNGVHLPTWVSKPMDELLTQYLSDWKMKPYLLRYAEIIPLAAIAEAHSKSREELHAYINANSETKSIPEAFTIGFARRATEYKRATLILSQPDRLLSMAHELGGLNIVFAGKAYHNDPVGREYIKKIMEMDKKYSDSRLRIIYLNNYDIDLAHRLVSGSDVWLNTPQIPHEASGTSGMKASLNGIPNVSVNDGWWIEGGLDGINGWTIKGYSEQNEIDSLYQIIHESAHLFYNDHIAWASKQRAAISLIASYFNTHRMVTEYSKKGYLRNR